MGDMATVHRGGLPLTPTRPVPQISTRRIAEVYGRADASASDSDVNGGFRYRLEEGFRTR